MRGGCLWHHLRNWHPRARGKLKRPATVDATPFITRPLPPPRCTYLTSFDLFRLFFRQFDRFCIRLWNLSRFYCTIPRTIVADTIDNNNIPIGFCSNGIRPGKGYICCVRGIYEKCVIFFGKYNVTTEVGNTYNNGSFKCLIE